MLNRISKIVFWKMFFSSLNKIKKILKIFRFRIKSYNKKISFKFFIKNRKVREKNIKKSLIEMIKISKRKYFSFKKVSNNSPNQYINF